VAKVGTSKAGGTISQQAAVHPWLAADAQGNNEKERNTEDTTQFVAFVGLFHTLASPIEVSNNAVSKLPVNEYSFFTAALSSG
jgi:hypothetical protein